MFISRYNQAQQNQPVTTREHRKDLITTEKKQITLLAQVISDLEAKIDKLVVTVEDLKQELKTKK
jgi:hypothetical protein